MAEFVGRQEELSLMDAEVRSGEILALVGPSGVGKTALAEHWLAHSERAGRTLTVGCRGRGPLEVAAAIGAATGVETKARLSEAEYWRTAAAGLDGVDTLLLDDVGFELGALAHLLRNWQGAVVVTTHRPPNDERSRALPVHPFDVTTQATLIETTAGRLFCSAAQATDLRFEPGAFAEEINDILKACDGFPLAIVLAARRSATLSCESVKRMLEEGQALRDLNQPERHHSMHAALDFTWSQLTADQKRLLYAMSLFGTEMTTQTVAELCGETLEATSARLHELVQMGLVSRGPKPRPLDSLSRFAQQVFPGEHAQQTQELRRRLRTLAVQAARQRRPRLARLFEFGDEVQLWDLALDDADALDDDELALVLAGWTRWVALRTTSARRSERLEQVRELIERADNWEVWQQLVWLYLYERNACVGECIERAKQAARTPEQLRDTLVREAGFHRQMLRNDEAGDALERAVAQAEPTYRYHTYRAQLLLFSGDKEQARAELDQAGRLLAGDDEVEQARLSILKAWCDENSRMKQARIERAHEIYRAHHRIGSQAWCLHLLATSVALDEDRFEKAWALLDEARELYRSIDLRRELRLLDIQEASLRLHAGQWARALALCVAVECDLAEGDALPVLPVRLIRAVAHWQIGESDAAQALWRADRSQWLEAPGFDMGDVFEAFDVGMLLDAGEVDEARRRAERAGDHERRALDALIAVHEFEGGGVEQTLELWQELRDALSEEPGVSSGHRIAAESVRAKLPPLLSRIDRLEREGNGVLILDDFRAFRAEDAWVDISSLATAMKLLEMLCTHDEPLDFDAIGEVLYPDDVITRDSLVNRINVQMSKLRRAGLKPFIVKRDDGFVFDGEFTLG